MRFRPPPLVPVCTSVREQVTHILGSPLTTPLLDKPGGNLAERRTAGAQPAHLPAMPMLAFSGRADRALLGPGLEENGAESCNTSCAGAQLKMIREAKMKIPDQMTSPRECR
jgi:hypothetical protein